MLNVKIDATPLRGKISGVGYYVYNLIQALDKLQDSENFELDIYFHPSLKNWLKRNFTKPELIASFPQSCIVPFPITLINVLTRFPNPILSKIDRYFADSDVVQGTDHFAYPSKNSLNIMTIHDLTFIKYPEYVTTIVKSYLPRIQQCLKWTDLIITFAESTRQDIVKIFNIDPQKIIITPQASRYSLEYLSRIDQESIQQTYLKIFSRPYFLSVSTLEPRKNITGIIQAFNHLKSNHKIEHQLVLIGQKGWKYQTIFAEIEASPYKKDIHHLDYLSDDAIAYFYHKATSFLYPSFYEGFGLPLLEAMTLGCPVITANTSSLPEVAAEAAILINPNQPLELAEAMEQIINHTQLRNQLIDKGRQRAQQFSWEKTAKLTLSAYRS